MPEKSSLAGYAARPRPAQQAGVLVLAVRSDDGLFTTNPDPNPVIDPHQVVIAVGTDDDIARLDDLIAR